VRGEPAIDREVVIQAFIASHEAELAAGYLREHGFSARVESHFMVDMNPYLSQALGGVRLYVPAVEAPDARAALDERAVAAESREDFAATVEPADDEERQDPAMAAEDAKALRAWNAAIVGLILFQPLLHLWAVAACADLDAAQLSPRGRLHRGVALTVSSAVLSLAMCFTALLI
jgi:hypothetical protein